MSDLLTALALAVVIEGVLYAAFPEQMKRMVAQLLEMPSQQLRVGALVIACAGLGVLMLVRM